MDTLRGVRSDGCDEPGPPGRKGPGRRVQSDQRVEKGEVTWVGTWDVRTW